MKTFALAILAYCAVALLAFGDVIAPLSLLFMWPDRLGAPLWLLIALGSVLLAAAIFMVPRRWSVSLTYKIPAFVALAMAIATTSVGIYANTLRQERLLAFKADASIDHSFFRSIREAPREFQFYLHAAALKDCVPYAWSYRTMYFYELPTGVAVNVLPAEWLERCSIHRT